VTAAGDAGRGRAPVAWAPSRPGPADVVWEPGPAGRARSANGGSRDDGSAGGGPRDGGSADEASSSDDLGAAGPARPRRVGPVGRWWARASAGRRLLVGYALVVVVALGVTLAVVPTQPVYGGSSPWKGVSVADLRTRPATDGWSLDLAGALAPDARPACLRFPNEVVSPGRILVGAAAAWTYGFANDAGCGSDTDGIGSRLALVDTVHGQSVWLHDLTADARGLGLDGSVEVISAAPAGDTGLMLVRAAVDDDVVMLTLDAATGRTVEAAAPRSATTSDQFQASGTTVLTGRQGSAGGRFVYEVRDVRDLGRVAWSGPGTTTGVALALDDRAVVATSDGTLQIDPSSGEATPWGTRLDALGGYVVRGGDLYSPTGDDGGFTARGPDGAELWRSSTSVHGSWTAARSCLVVTDVAADQVACLDYATGAVRWTRSGAGATSVEGLPGQTDDTVWSTTPGGPADDLGVRGLDGASGSVTTRLELPNGAALVAAGRTVGYALAYGSSGGRSSVIGFDLATGERLWRYSGQLQVSVWSGTLVDIDVDGVAHELTAPEARVVGA